MYKNPIRLRSNKYLIIYQTTLPLQELKDFLMQQLGVTLDSEWKYIFKNERYRNKSSQSIVYIELNSKSDVYSTKLNLKKGDSIVEGIYIPLSDNFLALVYLLKQTSKLKDIDHLTNFSEEELEPWLFLVGGEEVPVKQSSTKEAKTKIKRELKHLGPAQEQKINTYISRFEEEVSKDTFDLKELKRYVRNLTNYRYTYHLPKSLDDRITACSRTLSVRERSF